MLSLQLAAQPGRVLVATDAERVEHLQSLRGRFASASMLGSASFEVGLEDLLVNIYTLASWPSDDGDVTWDRELLELVETNLADSAVAQERLSEQRVDTPFDATKLAGGWHAPLTPFQARDLGRLLALAHGANFSVPGAGKTRVALAAFQARRDSGEVERLLVVAPKAAHESWVDELSACYGASAPLLSPVGEAGSATIALTNYERLPGSYPGLIRWLQDHPALLVLDEAHRTKLGPRGAWGSACLALAPYAHRRLILSGTPAPNGPSDLENLMGFVWPGQGRRTVAQAVAGGDLRAASQRLRPLFVRTTKAELQLPAVTRNVRRVPLSPLHRELYDALTGQVKTQWQAEGADAAALGRVLIYLLMAATTPALLATGLSPHEPLPFRIPPVSPPPGSSLAAMMRDLPHYELSPKYQAAAAIVAENAAEGRKTLVWSTFVRNLTSLAHLLSAYQPAVVYGGTEDRAAELQRFRQDPGCSVLLSNPATLGEGVSLHQVCHDAVYVDRDFSAGRFMQSLDRIHRLGLPPEATTTITVLVADRTVDELVEQRLAVKLDFLGTILDDPGVLELADLQEEDTIGVAGMNEEDKAALADLLRDVSAT